MVWKFHCFSDSSSNRGVSVLIKNGLNIEILDAHTTNDERKLLINVKYTPVNIHVHVYAIYNIIFKKIEIFFK